MRLRKWYLDCVAPDGTAWIGYWGTLRLGGIDATFVSSLGFNGSRSTTKTLLRDEREPNFEPGHVRWNAASLGVEGTWIGPAQGVERTLIEGVTWRCLLPHCDAVVRAGDRTIRGRGYAEVLELEIAPWQLPIRELRWGRALGATSSLVWIDWRGDHPLQLAVRDGAFAEVNTVSESEIRLASGAQLMMRERVTIREESLSRLLQPLARLLPHPFLAHEQKWRSRGTIWEENRLIDEGWVIHELVRFGR